MQLKRRRVQWDVETLISKIERGTVDIPRFQRGKVWNRKKRSEAIYSLLTIGLPDLILIEDRNGRLLLLDGLQRLSAVADFLNDEYRISLDQTLNHLDEELAQILEGKLFSELPQEVKNRLWGAELGAVIYSGVSQFEVAKEIFTRINYKPTPLAQQELLYVLTYDGEKSPLLRELGDELSPRRLKGFGILARILSDYTLLIEEGKVKEDLFKFSKYYEWLYNWLKRTFEKFSKPRLEELAYRAIEFINFLKGMNIDVVKSPYWSEVVAFLLWDLEKEQLPIEEYWEKEGLPKVEALRRDPRWLQHIPKRNKQKPATLFERFAIIADHFGVPVEKAPREGEREEVSNTP